MNIKTPQTESTIPSSTPASYWRAYAKHKITSILPKLFASLIAVGVPMLLGFSVAAGISGWRISVAFGIAGFLLTLTVLLFKPDKTKATLKILEQANHEMKSAGLDTEANNWKMPLYELVKENRIDVETALKIEAKMDREIFWHNSQFMHIKDIITEIKILRKAERRKSIRDAWLKNNAPAK